MGSKSSAEQEILGWIAVEALRAAGADVQEVALGSTVVIREAELAGLIDLYWEYTGTGWVELLRQTGPSSDPDELYGTGPRGGRGGERHRVARARPANSGYALVTAESTLESLDVSDLDDAVTSLEEEDEGVNLCVAEGSGFLDDPSGLIRLQSTYDMTIPASRIDQVPPRIWCPSSRKASSAPSLRWCSPHRCWSTPSSRSSTTPTAPSWCTTRR